MEEVVNEKTGDKVRNGRPVLIAFQSKEHERKVLGNWNHSSFCDPEFALQAVSPPVGAVAAWVVVVPPGQWVTDQNCRYGRLVKNAPACDTLPKVLTPREWSGLYAALLGDQIDFRWGDSEEIDSASSSVRWAWDGIVPDDALTLLCGNPKGGKSTLLRNLYPSYVNAAAFLGRPTGRTPRTRPVLVLSEEPTGVWRDTPPQVAVWNRAGETIRSMKEWVAFCNRVERQVDIFHFGLVVLDTLMNLVGVNENDPRKLAAVMIPLRKIAEHGPAVVVVHHTTKNGGAGPGMNSRGSGALPGLVDSVVEVERLSDSPTDPVRRLTAIGRLGPAVSFDYRMDGSGKLVAGLPARTGLKVRARAD